MTEDKPSNWEEIWRLLEEHVQSKVLSRRRSAYEHFGNAIMARHFGLVAEVSDGQPQDHGLKRIDANFSYAAERKNQLMRDSELAEKSRAAKIATQHVYQSVDKVAAANNAFMAVFEYYYCDIDTEREELVKILRPSDRANANPDSQFATLSNKRQMGFWIQGQAMALAQKHIERLR